MRKYSFLFILILLIVPVQAQVPDLPEYDPEIYYGYENGAAGIASGLLQVIKSDIIDIDTRDLLLDAVMKSMEAVWDHRTEVNGTKYATWSKGPEYDIEYIYPGVKYGAAGIIPVFLDLYDFTGDKVWFDRAVESFFELTKQAVGDTDLPHWPYSYYLPKEELGLSLNGIKYGNTGIIKLCLELYKITNTQFYLDYAKKIWNYLDTIIREVTIEDTTFNLYTWYFHPMANLNPILYGSSMGITGMAEVMIEYGELSGKEEYIEFAKQMLDFVVINQRDDGSWSNEYDYDDIILTNFEEGVSGIIYALYKLNMKFNDTQISDAVDNGINWLFSNYVSNSSYVGFLMGQDLDVYRNGIINGNLGVIKSLLSVLERLDTDRRIMLEDAINYLLGTQSVLTTVEGTDLMFMLDPQGEFFDLCQSTGSAGLLEQVLSYRNYTTTLSIRYDLSTIIMDIAMGITHFQEDDYFWYRHFLSPDWSYIRQYTIDITLTTVYFTPTSIPHEEASFLPFISFLVLIPIVVIINSFRRRG